MGVAYPLIMQVSRRAKKRGLPQMGTLGAGEGRLRHRMHGCSELHADVDVDSDTICYHALISLPVLIKSILILVGTGNHYCEIQVKYNY
jgi:hypothetical protein